MIRFKSERLMPAIKEGLFSFAAFINVINP